MLKTPLLKATFIVFTIFFTSLSWAQTRYVTDQFEITMRSGPSTSNNIISMLKSGEKVTIIEQDDVTKYSLVETSKGKKGYVITRFLDNVASGRTRFSNLQIQTDKLKATIENLRQEASESKTQTNNDSSKILTLSSDLTKTESELNDLKAATHDTILVLQQNDSLKSRINDLEADKLQLLEENTGYKDSTAMDWFIRGSAVSLIAFLLGIIVTRISWKKRDSWSNY